MIDDNVKNLLADPTLRNILVKHYEGDEALATETISLFRSILELPTDKREFLLWFMDRGVSVQEHERRTGKRSRSLFARLETAFQVAPTMALKAEVLDQLHALYKRRPGLVPAK